MISDIIDKELMNNAEYRKLEVKIKNATERINELYEEYNSAIKRNRRLERIELICQIIALISCFFNLTAIPYCLLITAAYKYGKKLNVEIENDYIKEINKTSTKLLTDIKRAKEILYETCDIVEEKLQTFKNEAEWHLKNRNYDEILKNYQKYENVLLLIENDCYNNILSYLIYIAKSGIKNINDIPETDKYLLNMVGLEAIQIDKTEKQKHKSFGKKQREIDEAMEEAIKESIESYIHEETEKSKTLKKTKK